MSRSRLRYEYFHYEYFYQEIDLSNMYDSINNILCQEVDPVYMSESIMNTFTLRSRFK